MTIPAITPVSCPACFRSVLLPESDLLRLPHTILFHCPYCQSVVTTVDRSRDHNSAIADDGNATAA